MAVAFCSSGLLSISLLFSVIAKNNSTQKLGKVIAQIMQYATFTGNGKEECVNSTIKYIQSSTELEAVELLSLNKNADIKFNAHDAFQ
jgi:hypothetical protein